MGHGYGEGQDFWLVFRGVHPPKQMMHIPPYFHTIYKFSPIFVQFTFFGLIYVFFLPPYFDHASCFSLHVLDAPACVNGLVWIWLWLDLLVMV